jgi:hypothetical protein
MKLMTIGMALALALTGCGKKSDDKGGDKAAPSVQVSPEMKDFTASLTGKSAAVKAALAKYGTDGLASQDMDMYNLSDATVTANEKKGDQDCYTFDAKSGATTRTYVTCWKGGKIVAVEDKGMH